MMLAHLNALRFRLVKYWKWRQREIDWAVLFQTIDNDANLPKHIKAGAKLWHVRRDPAWQWEYLNDNEREYVRVLEREARGGR